MDIEAVADDAERRLLDHLRRARENGWTPAELVRQARRSTARAGRLMAIALRSEHADRGWVRAFLVREGMDRVTALRTLDEAVTAAALAGPLPSASDPSTHDGVDDPVLAKVRALLAKAESTTFEAEATAFTAKAQELMARHAIDHAAAWDRKGRGETPIAARIPIDEPYARAKYLLLQYVATRSRCRAAYMAHYALASVVGFAADVAAAELLFTSLLVQAQVALQAEAPGAHGGARSFRRSFLLAYALRIDERLAAVNQAVEHEVDAQGPLLPVLVARSAAVDEAVDELLGKVRRLRVGGAGDPLGWARGRSAADRAQLTSGDLANEPVAISGR